MALKKGPRVLLFDVESFPNLGYTWGAWEQNVIEFVEPKLICCIAWQWYPSREKFVLALPDLPGYDPEKRDNRALMRAFHKEISKADIAIGHNIDAFDDRMINADFLKNNLPPPSPHKPVDTLKICRSKFRLNSNKLNDVCQELGIGKKVAHPGFALWKGCMAGDPKSWALMKRYNLGDVDPLLRGLYERLRPWMTTHPNMTALDSHDGCPACRSKKLQRRGWQIAGGNRRARFQCQECGKWCTGSYIKEGWRFR